MNAGIHSIAQILVPTDFGDAANQALTLAITLASRFDAAITLLHTCAVPVSRPMDDVAGAVHGELDAVLAGARERYARIEAVLAWGEPWQEILEGSRACRAELIVMGTHGRRGFSRVLLGSVAEKVVRLSPIPVVTVCGNEAREAKALSFVPVAMKRRGESVVPSPPMRMSASMPRDFKRSTMARPSPAYRTDRARA
ncbi:universal stress protein [Pendulispora brunnea]|uniref:Universal stress protein n=1 Tax=Pendulispora brunnea TaxID=2905690 RepID=A0ABZ2JZ28_9BACT